MAGPVRPPLRVIESDDSVDVFPTNKISFNDADFTISKSGTTATISIDSTGTGATLTDTYVGFGDASNLMTGSANFTFTEETGGTGPIVLLTGDKPILRLQDDTDATDYKSSWEQSGNSLYLYNGDSAGNNYEIHRISPSYVWWNRGNDNLDMFYDSANIEKFFTIDVSQDNVAIGGVPDSGVERLHVQGSNTGGATPLVVFESDGAGTTDAPFLDLHRSITGVNNSDLGNLRFTGFDDGDNKTIYGRIWGEIRDATDGQESGAMIHHLMINDTEREMMRLSGSAGGSDTGHIIFNEGGIDIDFRVESKDVSSMFHIIGSTNLIGIGAAPSSGEAQFQVDEDATFNTYVIPKNAATSLLTGAEVQNTLVTVDYSGGAATPTISSGTAGECVTILNLNATQTVTVTAGVGITFASTPAVLNQWESEKWVCYKSNNWVRVANES